MAHVIALPCIGVKDGACITACPVDCIRPTKEDGAFENAEQLYIDPDTCIDCGHCVMECPVNAIFLDSELPEQWHSFIDKNAAFFRAEQKP